MRGHLLKVTAVAAACLLCARAASAQAGPSPTPTPATPPTVSPEPSPTRTPRATDPEAGITDNDRARARDKTFMTRAQLRALEQLELARIVAARSSNNSVRSFGQRMVVAREKTSEELRLLAETHGVDLPATLDAAGKDGVVRLSKLSSPELDRAYVERALKNQDAEVADFEAQGQAAQEVELQAWVWNTLPLLQEEQEQVHAIAGELGIKARGAR